jgi:hypothetical protein
MAGMTVATPDRSPAPEVVEAHAAHAALREVVNEVLDRDYNLVISVILKRLADRGYRLVYVPDVVELHESQSDSSPDAVEALRRVIEAARAVVAAWEWSRALWERAKDEDILDEISDTAADRIDKPEAELRAAVAALAAAESR